MKGLSLLEMMVALAMSALIMSGLLHAYVVNHKRMDAQTQLSSLLDNRMLVTHLMTHDLQQAGFFGCATPTTMQNKIFISDEGRSIQVSYLDNPLLVEGNLISNNSITLMHDINLKPGDAVMLVNCEFEMITTIESVYGDTIYLRDTFQGDSNKYYQFGRVLRVRYFIKESTLYRQQAGRASQALVDDVSDLSFYQDSNVLYVEMELQNKPWYLHVKLRNIT